MNNALMAIAIGAATLMASVPVASAATCKTIGKKAECTVTSSVTTRASSALGTLSMANARASSIVASAGSKKSSSLLNQSSRKTKKRTRFASVGLSLGNVLTQPSNRSARVASQVVPAQSLVATPVPPAALLFGTALLGIGFMARRRSGNGVSTPA
jgi:hypothetical protein